MITRVEINLSDIDKNGVIVAQYYKKITYFCGIKIKSDILRLNTKGEVNKKGKQLGFK